MAIEGKVNFKTIEFNKAYIAYYSHKVHKFTENHIDSIGNHQYCLEIEVHIFADHTKEMVLKIDTIFAMVNNIDEVTIDKIWNIIKTKYNGVDIL